MHVHMAIHACMQMRLDENFKEAENAFQLRLLDADATRQEYTKKHVEKKRST